MDKSSQKIRIVVADDHLLFRDGLRRLLESEDDFTVIGEASDGKEALGLVRKLQPDILLLDVAMPRVSGLSALREMSGWAPSVRTLLLTAAIEKRQIVEALQLGAKGVVLKESATELLFKGIRSVMDGQYWVGRESVSDLVKYLQNLIPASAGKGKDKKLKLSPRELEIIAAVVSGQTNKDIAGKFSISEQTVKHHLTSIFDKLGIDNRLELALFAINHNLLNP